MKYKSLNLMSSLELEQAAKITPMPFREVILRELAKRDNFLRRHDIALKPSDYGLYYLP